MVWKLQAILAACIVLIIAHSVWMWVLARRANQRMTVREYMIRGPVWVDLTWPIILIVVATILIWLLESFR